MTSANIPKIEKAQSRMLFKHMFFAAVIVATTMVETKTKCKRAATDMVRVYWNPDFFDTIDTKVVMFVLAHEIFHIILKHGLRQGGREHKLWNIACDHVINLHLLEQGFTLWPDCCQDVRFTGMYEEQVYAILESEQRGESTILGDALGEDLVEGEADLNDPIQRVIVDQAIDRLIAQAMTMAKQAGKMPAGLAMLMEGVINPPLSWYSIFMEHMRRFVNEHDSWNRRNRKFADMILPTRRNLGMGPVGIIGDTSGSMTSYRIYPQVSEELTVMMEQARPEFIQVIWADHADFSHEERFETGDVINLHPHGGGGTDMRLPLKRMAEVYEVDVCILITDAETPWPSEPTPFPLIILTTTNEATPDWATTIRIR